MKTKRLKRTLIREISWAKEDFERAIVNNWHDEIINILYYYRDRLQELKKQDYTFAKELVKDAGQLCNPRRLSQVRSWKNIKNHWNF